LGTKISVENISKNFGTRKVLKNLTFSLVSPASIGITGSNGSGKTTLMKILSMLIPSTKGNVTISQDGAAIPSADFIKFIKMVSPEMALYEMLTGYENLEFFAKLAEVELNASDKDAHLDSVGLRGRGADMVGGYSSGMKQRLKYAVALLSQPEILLLDEPTSNLDEEGKAIIAAIIDKQRREKIVIIATNEQEDLSRADHVIRLDN
jgi:heme exporter protein A